MINRMIKNKEEKQKQNIEKYKIICFKLKQFLFLDHTQLKGCF